MKLRLPVAIGSGVACCLLLGAQSVAQAQETRVRPRRDTQVTSTVEVRRLSEVMGASVRLQSGDQFGKIEDVVISPDGCIEYVVVSYEDKFIPVPWTLAKIDYKQHTLRIDFQKDRLIQAPSFARDQWTEMSTGDYTQKVRQFYGVRGERRLRDRNPRRDRERPNDRQNDRPSDRPER